MEFLLSTILSCSEGKWILDGIAQANLNNKEKSQLVIEIISTMPDDCESSDYRGDRRKS